MGICTLSARKPTERNTGACPAKCLFTSCFGKGLVPVWGRTITKHPARRSIEVFRIDYHSATRSGEPDKERLVHVVPQKSGTPIDKRCNHSTGMSRRGTGFAECIKQHTHPLSNVLRGCKRRNSEFLIAHVAPCCEVAVAVGVLYLLKQMLTNRNTGRFVQL